MPYTPQYGGINGVVELNIGQTDSPRRTGGFAIFTPHMVGGADTAIEVPQNVVQQNVAFQDVLGFQHALVGWEGDLRVVNAAQFVEVQNELNKYLHGSTRTSGTLNAPDVNRLKPTRLTDTLGNTLSQNARMIDWRWTTRILRMSNGTSGMLYLRGLRIDFKLLR